MKIIKPTWQIVQRISASLCAYLHHVCKLGLYLACNFKPCSATLQDTKSSKEF